MKRILFLAAIVGTVLAGCSKDKEKDDGKMDVLVCMHYDSSNPGRQTNIIAMLPDGTNPAVLKNKGGYIYYFQPFAIPARNKIVYCEFYDNEDESNHEYFCSVRIMNTDGTGDAVLIPKGANDEHFANPNTNAAGNKMVYSHMTESHNKRGDIIICDFNGTALSNKKTIYTDNGGNIQIWRAMFSRIDKAVYNALPNAN